MDSLLNRIIEKNKCLTNKGKVASYIPALERVNPNYLGACIADMNGNLYTAGDYNRKFTLQSISKTVSLMLAIMDNGTEEVFSKVGMEPTGDAFNSIIRLETISPSKPLNPMINAGAIAVDSMIKGKNSEEKFNRLLKLFRKICSNEYLNINEEVYLSEKQTGNRNRALAYFMKDVGIISGDVEDILDIYFKQCSIEVDCIDIARIGLFLANNGVILDTGERVVEEKIAKTIKTFMVTCGMYNASGEFAINVGVPAKSGVGGGIMAAVPLRMGVGVFSPALDDKGNSLAGYGVLKDLSRELDLSFF
ncbi:L-glutaminase [Proteiniborus ethanoligenes]|uniref:Glutaminase n=1 Tax=Proteiniborus ethanoligenes TaxID=415015 RepID=A0A1H3SAQ6_9FIRM|nr:glutaminase A [Proteiniborus ethanoligenes]TAH63872.1 MAG: glutaminase A [Gottschalkiaceae bacterium]SDZ35126.1 L-glutaminase [Proteiniborus ethanoligenes]